MPMGRLDAHSDSNGSSAEEHGKLGGKPLIIRNGVLPEDKHFPAKFSKPLQVSPVTSQGALEFLPPEHIHGKHIHGTFTVPQSTFTGHSRFRLEGK
jgi:hypothetical protein